MSSARDVIHQPVRLKILASLNASRGKPLEFSRLKAITETTNGNLGSHLASLETAGYVKLEKIIEANRPRTNAYLTPAGRKAFQEHLIFLRDIIDTAGT